MKRLIIDTGSNVSILQPGVSRRDVRVTARKPYGVTGEDLDIKGQQLVSFVLGGRKFSHTFLVCPLPTDKDGLFGTDFLEKVGAGINFDLRELSLVGINKAPYACNNRSTKHAVLTVFPNDTTEKVKPLRTRREEPKARRPRLDSHASNETTRHSRSWLVKTAQEVTIAPRCRHVVTSKLDLGKGKESPSLVCVDPAAIPIQGIRSARALKKVGTRERDSTRLTSPPEQANVDASANSVDVMLANFSQEELTLPKATVLGLAEEVPETLIGQISNEKPQGAGSPNSPQKGARNKALYDKLVGGKLGHLNTSENLRPKVPKLTRGPEQLIESLKASLRQAYRAVARANRKSYVANKERYDKRAKSRSFEVGSYVYLFNPARKPGLSKKFFSAWSGPFRVMAKLSESNYEILGQSGRKFVVHLNRLKACYGHW